MSIQIKVRATSETVVGDPKVQDQSHRSHRVPKVVNQLIPTIPTPAFSYMLRFRFICCAKKVSKLVNRPVVGGTSTEMIT